MATVTPSPSRALDRSSRPRRRRAGPTPLAELAIVLPLFLVLLVGVVDLGANYADHLDTDRSTAATARALSADRLHDGTTCDLHVRDLSDEEARVACTAKAETHAEADAVRVHLSTAPGSTTGRTESVPAVVGVTETICVMTRATSATGLLTGAFSGRVHTSRATVTVPRDRAVDAVEPPFDGADWSWCR